MLLEMKDASGEKVSKKLSFSLKKQRLLKSIGILLFLFIFMIVGTLGYISYTKRNFNLTFYRVTSSHVTEKFRIIFVSDLHLREYGENNEELIGTIQKLEPDLIILGGDLVTFPNPDYENMISFCESISEIAPVYGVLGNHESEIIYGGIDDQLAEKFSDAGVRLLRNEEEELQIGNNRIELIGLEGALADFYKYGASERMESLDDMYDAFRICVDHVPMAFIDYLQDFSFDLGFAGHTHGGLIQLPILGRLYSAEEGFFPEYAGGQYNLNNGATLIVGCGLGESSWVPRIYNPPELVLVDVNWY